MRVARTLALGLALLLPALAVVAWFVSPRELRTMLAFVAWRALPWNAPERSSVPVSDITMHVETFGAGDPVLLLHGGFGTLEVVGNQIRLLAPKYRVIAPDSRAHGRTSDGDGPITYDVMAEDFSALLRAEGIPRAHVVGWSDGANDALLLAIRHPDQVASVVAISPNAFPEATKPEALAELGPLTLDNPNVQMMRQLYDTVSPTPEHFPIYLDKMAYMVLHEPHITAEQLATISAPTLVVGAEDDIMFEDHLRWIASAIPGAEVRITRGTQHQQPMNDPDQVNEAIETWLAAHPLR